MPHTGKSLALICFLMAIIPACLHAQFHTKQNKVWIFGRNAGINFTSGTAVPISSDIYTDEGSASVADTAGNLLFYSQGDSVWNRNNEVMPNGAGLAPFSCLSTTQAAVIVPVNGSATQYYLFSLEHILASGRLAYSIVDMSLDGGLGDVLPSAKGILIDSGFSEKMMVVRGQCCMWLLLHKVDNPEFYAYKITGAGIDTDAVVSSVGTNTDYEGYGVIKISPDRSKIALTHFELSSFEPSRTELYDFNPATGIVSNARVLNTYSTPYGAEFSANSKKLYVHHWTYGKLLQYDVSLPTTAAIIASEYTVAGSLTTGSDMRLAPDSNIYFSSSPYDLSRINDPDLSGSACNYVANFLDMSPNTVVLGLPALYWSDTTCPPTTIQAAPTGTPGISVYPNPAKDKLNITLPGNGISDIQLIDILGRPRLTAMHQTGKQVTLDISGLPNGNYNLRVEYEGNIYRSAVVIDGR